jgi:PPOX class probable F420-dependent enzyme
MSATVWGRTAAVTDLDDVRRIAAADHYLAVVTTTRADGSVQASLVNAGVLAHPGDGNDVVGYVARGDSRKLVNLRARPSATVVVHTGWEWAAVEGSAELIGPDDPHPAVGVGDLAPLLRAVFVAAGGTHDDWDEYDAVMARERRTVVLVRPRRVYSNG